MRITYTKGNVTDTIIINDYFKTVDGKATSSSVKSIIIGNDEYTLTDLYKYVGTFTPSGKGSVTGTVFSDVIDESDYRNDQKKGLTIKAGNGNDVITGSRYNDTITGGKGNNTVVLQGQFGDDKIVTTKGETVNISLDRDMDQLEYVLDGKNVKAVAKFPETTYCLKGLVYIGKPMELSNGTYCKVDSKVDKVTITIYTPNEVEDGYVDDTAGEDHYSQKIYTRFYVVKDEDGGYKWESEDILAGLDLGAELRLTTEPRLDELTPSQLEDIWTNTGDDNYDYMLRDSNIFRVETFTNEEGEVETREINVSKEVAKLLKNGGYDASSFFGTKGEIDGSVSVTGMASKKLTADVLVNGTNLEEYLSTEGYLNVKGQKKLTGTRFNDRFVGSEYNDTITGKLGNNLYDIDTSKDFGDDTVVLTRGETMTLSFDKNNYKTSDLKFELVNGGKDIKISSDVDTNVPPSESYEIQGYVTPVYIGLGTDEDGDPIYIDDNVQDPVLVSFRLVKGDDGEYRWMSDNILENILPDAKPIKFELPINAPELRDESTLELPDGIFSEDYPGYEYMKGDWDDDDMVLVTVTDIRALKIVGDTTTDISNALNQELTDETYNPEKYLAKTSVQLSDFEGSVTLKNFGQKDLGAIVKIGDSDLENYLKNDGVVQVSGKGKITATRFNDNITGSASADKIYTYAGTDTVNAGKGNDKIYLGEGNKTLSFKSGDGNDIIYSAKLADSVDLQIDGADTLEYARKGNNLVITRIDNDGKTVNNKALKTLYLTQDGDLTNVKKGNIKVGTTLYSYTKNGETKYSLDEVEGGTDVSKHQFFLENGKVVKEGTHTEALSETITIDGYFKDKTNITLGGNTLVPDMVKYSGSGRVTFGNDGYNYDITTGKKNDTITLGGGNNIVSSGAGNDRVTILGDGNNTLNYTAGKDTYTVGKGNDTYNVDFGKKTNLIISDNGGSDVLNLTTTGNITYLFNVDKNGDIVADSSLMIYDSDSLSRSKKKVLSGGKVEITNYFGSGDNSGEIETIKKNDETFAFNPNSITAEVASWLKQNDYDNTMDAIAKCDNEQYTKLIEIYQGIS